MKRRIACGLLIFTSWILSTLAIQAGEGPSHWAPASSSAGGALPEPKNTRESGPRSFRFPDRGAPLPDLRCADCPPPTEYTDPLKRAGHPECVSTRAVPSNNCRYGGYYVGGGLPVRGEGRHSLHEGTWGWDYSGFLFRKNIALNWSHGTRTQGGTGAYKSDGPKLHAE